MNKNESHRTTVRAAWVAAIVAAFVGGLLIPSPVFRLNVQSGSGNIFLAKDTTEMVMPDGSVYEGTVNACDGKFNGYGVLKTADASYTGRWKNGALVFGKMTSGQMSYEGPFGDGLAADGFGIVHYTAEHIDSLRSAGVPDNAIMATYIGNLRNNVRNGLGRAMMADSTIAFGRFRDGDLVKVPGARFRPGETVYGIDISHYQPNLDWDNFALFCDSMGRIYYKMPVDTTYMQPVFFAYIKASEGSSLKDDTFAANMLEAKRHGIARGAYHFLRLSGRVEDQIANFTETVRWRPGDLPPVLDVEEETEILSFGVDNFADFTYDWLKGVEAALGVRPVIYTTDKLRNLYMKPDSRFDEYDFWIARYSRNKPSSTDWKFWQFTYQGLLNGYDATVDVDVYNSDFSSFSRYLKKAGR